MGARVQIWDMDGQMAMDYQGAETRQHQTPKASSLQLKPEHPLGPAPPPITLLHQWELEFALWRKNQGGAGLRLQAQSREVVSHWKESLCTSLPTGQ